MGSRSFLNGRALIASLLSGVMLGQAFGAPRPASAIQANQAEDQAFYARAELHDAVTDWIAATNAKDLEAQSRFYPAKMEAFYLWRNTPRTEVLAEKRRVFDRASLVDIKIETPQIVFDSEPTTARMYFRKKYVIVGERREREGEVLQELRWRKQPDGWKIVSERDLRVLN